MPAINIVDKFKAVQYTGSNSAEIQSLVTNTTLISESGGVLVLESPTGSMVWTINTGDWVRYTQNQISNIVTDSSFGYYYIRNAVNDDLTSIISDISDLQVAVTALQAINGLLSAGIKECPTLSPGTTVVSVDLTVAMTDTSYTPHAQVFVAAGVAGSLSITSVAVADVDTVDVTVDNTSLLGITGARILVTVTA
jgi:hypothetical protein